jgi:transcription antitermination factor NusG
MIFRRQGETFPFQKPCFPGYVFVESVMSLDEFMVSLIQRVKSLYKVLSYDGKSDIALDEEERVLLDSLFGKERCIDIPRVRRERGEFKIISGSLVGYEDKVIKIDNKKGLWVEFKMLGKKLKTVLGVEVVGEDSVIAEGVQCVNIINSKSLISCNRCAKFKKQKHILTMTMSRFAKRNGVLLSSLFGENRCIDAPTVLKEGDTVKIISGALAGQESKIVKIEKDMIFINFEILGKVVPVSIGAEIVRKV